jgi:HD-GYP domain-containing protein (c-di-GMP phosphodiesterase class II)
MGTASILTETLAATDAEFRAHSDRVTGLALQLAGVLDAGDDVDEAIRIGGPLHDVGKLGISDEILCKPGPLDPAELAEIRKHPVTGAALVRSVRALRPGVACVLHHHERWDGGGYPYGLGGTAIPLEARIVAVADAWDAMVSDRPYRVALLREAALAEVERCCGTQFDPDVAAVLLSLHEQRQTA